MEHRHLIRGGNAPPRLAEIDDIIERGGIDDWVALARAVRDAPALRNRLQELAQQTALTSERPDRPGFWLAFCNYVERQDSIENNERS